MLSVLTRSGAILLGLTWGVDLPFVRRLWIQTLPARSSVGIRLGFQVPCRGITVLVFKSPLFYLITAPKRERSGADDPDTLQRSCKSLPLNENVMAVWGKHGVYIRTDTVRGFRHPLGVLARTPGMRGQSRT